VEDHEGHCAIRAPNGRLSIHPSIKRFSLHNFISRLQCLGGPEVCSQQAGELGEPIVYFSPKAGTLKGQEDSVFQFLTPKAEASFLVQATRQRQSILLPHFVHSNLLEIE
jgi:hypothetical protein